MSARATDDELDALQPIIAELLDLLDPHVASLAYRAAHTAGATVRVLIVPEVDVDVIELARYVRRRTGETARVIDANPKRRLALRRRLEDYAAHIKREGSINRSDMMRIGEISIAQASADMAALVEDYPGFGLRYDASAKTYLAVRLGREAE